MADLAGADEEQPHCQLTELCTLLILDCADDAAEVGVQEVLILAGGDLADPVDLCQLFPIPIQAYIVHCFTFRCYPVCLPYTLLLGQATRLWLAHSDR